MLLEPCTSTSKSIQISEWLPHAKPGEVHDGVRCEDVQRLTYPENYFDFIVTSETLEHVSDPDKAWHENLPHLEGRRLPYFYAPSGS
jgi:2-polyprenyl-3-methyl-5-hydroxy-6-metoxy-1,4-benzoquinol methylase